LSFFETRFRPRHSLIFSAVEHCLDAGDHVLIVGRVLSMVGPRDDEPLMFYRSRYGTFSALTRADAGEFVLGWGL